MPGAASDCLGRRARANARRGLGKGVLSTGVLPTGCALREALSLRRRLRERVAQSVDIRGRQANLSLGVAAIVVA